MSAIKLTKRHARKINELLNYGLVSGLGSQRPGEMCVEAAVCCALGLPHGDNPPCVGRTVRAFKIRLNDCNWPTDKDRAEGMRGLAIAQLGSDSLDQMEFGKLMFLRGTQILLPFIWRKEADKISAADKKSEMIEWCQLMEKCETFDEARELTKDASAYASAAVGYASDYASDAASYAYAYADYASAYASASASASGYRHELLMLTAHVGLNVLIEMKSPGCKWLGILDEK
jgi:hypothetical protein